ncbi:hypothetical protein KO465_04350 [Candidatus Micrarchaeota archaeon]|jgi:alanine dehydrogenase|nr:hypothetical protein [Candidatus Micrarchaeota archaeon]
MAVMIEIPQMVIDAGAIAVSAALIGAGFAAAVIAIDHAFDRVKESAWNYINARLDLEKEKRSD